MDENQAVGLLSRLSNTDLQIFCKQMLPLIEESGLFSAVEMAGLERINEEGRIRPAAKGFRNRLAVHYWFELLAFLLVGERLDQAEAMNLVEKHHLRLKGFCQRGVFNPTAVAGLRDELARDANDDKEDADGGWAQSINDPAELGRRLLREQVPGPLFRTCLGYLLEVGREARAMSADEYRLIAEARQRRDGEESKKMFTVDFILPLLAYLTYGQRVDGDRAALFLRHDCVKVKHLLGGAPELISRKKLQGLRSKTTLIGQKIKHLRLQESLVTRRAWRSFLRKADMAVFTRFSTREVFASIFTASFVSAESESGQWLAYSREAGVKFVLTRREDGFVIEDAFRLLPAERRRVRKYYHYEK